MKIHISKAIFCECRRIINLCCISAIYAKRDTTEVQDIHFRPMLKLLTRLSHPSFSSSIVSLFLADKRGTYYQECARGIAISQNCPKVIILSCEIYYLRNSFF